MVKGIIYNPECGRSGQRAVRLYGASVEFNQLKPSEGDKKVKYMKETFAEVTIVSGVTIGGTRPRVFYRDEKIDGENLK